MPPQRQVLPKTLNMPPRQYIEKGISQQRAPQPVAQRLGQALKVGGAIAGGAAKQLGFNPAPAQNPYQQAVLNRNMRDQLLGSLKKGGPIKKAGIYQLHKGEYVLSKKDHQRAISEAIERRMGGDRAVFRLADYENKHKANV